MIELVPARIDASAAKRVRRPAREVASSISQLNDERAAVYLSLTGHQAREHGGANHMDHERRERFFLPSSFDGVMSASAVRTRPAFTSALLR